MSRVFFDVGVSLDGFLAGDDRGPHNPLGRGGVAMHEWMFRTASFVERHTGRAGGERSPDDDLVRRVFERTGASILGLNMFEEGEANWPEEAPFRTPVFVLSPHERAPWPRPGGTTFHFVTEGIHRALELAREAADGRDVRIAGGADTIQQYLVEGLVDEFTLHVAPRLLGGGLRLFDELTPEDLRVEPVGSSASRYATHLDYRIVR